MKRKKQARFILLFLAVFALILTAACGGGGQDSQSNNNQGNQGGGDNNNPDIPGADEPGELQNQEKLPLDLPEANYGGYNFRILNAAQDDAEWLQMTIVTTEEDDMGIEINDAVFKRNRTVEDRFNINIVEISVPSRSDVPARARRSIDAGSDDYDLVMPWVDASIALAQRGSLVDYNELTYVNLDRPYWDKDMRRDLSVGNRNYFMIGDFSMTHYSSAMAMFFNKKLINDLGLESPYNVINEGRWTYDKFYEFALAATHDLNGDGRYDENDRYGYMSLTFLWSPSFMASAGQQAVLKDANDMHYLAVENERYATVFNKMNEMMHSQNILFDADVGGRDHRLQDVMFPGNQALFWSELVHWSTILRDMEADFGIIVHPKFDESQDYAPNLVNGPPIMGVPATSQDLDRTSMILEALCYESTDTVIKAYYDVLLKTKIARDNESEAMLDIMFNNRFYNIAAVYYNDRVSSGLNGLSARPGGDLVSWLDRNKERIEVEISRINEEMQ
ncbi:MAG: extracellular solute-binding protein [Oscillospiraceae bacterium]|nr:extracellular solute-binding protein [Oscillospiraceae bacterium]